MMKAIRILLATTILLSLVSCAMLSFPFKRRSYSLMSFAVPDGTPAFQAGYKAGCSAVSYARGNVLYRSRFGYHYDIKMIDNADYKSGYSRGWGWCFNQIVGGDPTYGVVGGGGSGIAANRVYPYGEPSLSSEPNSVNSAWGEFFGSKAPNIIETGSGLDGSFGVWGGGGGGSVFGANPLWSSGEVHFMGIW